MIDKEDITEIRHEDMENTLLLERETSEEVLCDDTVIEEPKGDVQSPLTETPKKVKKLVSGICIGVAIGGISSILKSVGATAAGIQESGHELNMSQDSMDVSGMLTDNAGDPYVEVELPELVVVGSKPGLTFAEAFNSARTQAGAGGVFEWQGKVYGTYTAEEWEELGSEQKSEFANQFNWNNIDSSESDVASFVSLNDRPVSETLSGNGVTPEAGEVADDDIEVVSVSHGDSVSPISDALSSNSIPGDAEIEILGVLHDNLTGANIGNITVDGQEAVLIDVDGDTNFDYLGADFNKDGTITPDEVLDIRHQQITTASIPGTTELGGAQASADLPDYSIESSI